MKAIIAALTAVSFLAGAAIPASAQIYTEGYEIKQKYVKKKHKRHHRRVRVYNDGEVHYRRGIVRQPQYWADKLPTGTPDWWRQMDREGRGGRRQ